ncbi:MAG: glucose-1-phosphate cytidylyltransferase [Rhizomicrobium sp.]
MKVVLLAGGLGTRLSEETQLRPKPMVEIGGQPILWHIMMMYAQHGLHDFIVCCGYKGYFIKEYFANFVLHRSDVTIDLSTGRIEYQSLGQLPGWSVTLVDTGAETMTGGRLRRVGHLLPKDEPFCLTYGDGVSDIDVTALIAQYRASGLEAIVTAVQPPSRYGVTVVEGDRVLKFAEKPPGEGGRINGGFFVLDPKVVRRIAGDSTVWEAEPLESLAADHQLGAYRHDGFWYRTHRLRLTQVDDAAARAIEAVATDPSIYEPLTGPSRGPLAAQSLAQPGRALAVFLDLPLLTGKEVPHAPTVAAFAAPWPGAIQVLKSVSDANFTLSRALTKAAMLGRTTAAFYAGPLWRWDRVNALRIRLAAGALAAQDDLAVLGGANALAVQNEDGQWEIVQFAAAALTAPSAWTLTRLLRGQAGTEGAMRNPIAAGARVVLLDGATQQLDLAQNEATLPFFYAWGPPGKPLSDPSWQTAQMQFEGIGLRPLSPVHLAAHWRSGDLVLSWIRRTRLGGDNWDQTDVPLAEENERYDIEILDAGGHVIRAISANPSASYTYAAAQIAADFPSGLPSPLHRLPAQRCLRPWGRDDALTHPLPCRGRKKGIPCPTPRPAPRSRCSPPPRHRSTSRTTKRCCSSTHCCSRGSSTAT